MPTLGSAPPKPRLSRGSYLEARKIPRCVRGRGGGEFSPLSLLGVLRVSSGWELVVSWCQREGLVC